jgi:hypothetical protein
MHKNWEGALQHEVWKVFIHDNIEGLELSVLTFVITEEIHGTHQTSVGYANPRDQVSATSLKDQ